jgi:chemotaxis signal transduction protein
VTAAGAVEAVWRERAQRLSERPVAVQAGKNAFPVLVLAISKERYAIDLPDVIEVLAPVRPTPVPGIAAVFAGVINVHGGIRPVLDLRRLLGMPAQETETTGSGNPAKVILLRRQGREIGLQIDSVEQIRSIGAGELQPAGAGAIGSSPYIKGTTQDLLMLLSTAALFAELRISELNQSELNQTELNPAELNTAELHPADHTAEPHTGVTN